MEERWGGDKAAFYLWPGVIMAVGGGGADADPETLVSGLAA